MFPIQPGRRRQRNKKLAPIRIGPRIRHAQNPRPGVLERGVDLVSEGGAPGGFPAAAGARGVAGLDHEARDHAVDGDVGVVGALDEGGEVGAGGGGVGGVEFDGEGSHGCVDSDESCHGGIGAGESSVEEVVGY